MTVVDVSHAHWSFNRWAQKIASRLTAGDRHEPIVNVNAHDHRQFDAIFLGGGAWGASGPRTCARWAAGPSSSTAGPFSVAPARVLASGAAIYEAKGGVIVNLGSIAGLVGFPKIAAYCTAKAAVIGLTRQMAADYTALGIRVNCLCP